MFWLSQVRSAVSANIPAVCGLVAKAVVVSRVLPIVQRLVSDSSEHVRASVASVINELAAVLGKEETIDLLLPTLLALLRDETSEVLHALRPTRTSYRITILL